MTKRDQHPPSVSETAFECPHCGAYTTQQWYRLSATALGGEHRTPTILTAESRRAIDSDADLDPKVKASVLEWAAKMARERVFFEANERGRYVHKDVSNLSVSECFNCHDIAVWVHQQLVFPPDRGAAPPNPDLPHDIVRDYEEAREIVASSPRGSAALLRLCIQKLCMHLGEKGKSIDDDIASLVAKGLNPLVQKSLDVVRVVGNEAVHPGTLDLRDNRDSALQLFTLVNVVADQMISHPKAIEALYQSLPAGKREAILRRDGSKNGDVDESR